MNAGDSSDMAKKILLIAFDFPPRRTSGVYRPVALVRHLVELGWQATVLTITDEGADVRDKGLLEKIPPQVRIVRTPYLRINAWENAAAKAARFSGASRADHGPARRADVAPPARPSRLHLFLAAVARSVRALLYFPDEFVGWVPWGLAAGIDLCFGERFDVVYTTSPPRSTPLIGLFLKLFLGVTWVAESRDPWLIPIELDGTQAGAKNTFSARIRQAWARWVDKLLIRNANMVITVTRGYAADLQSRYRAAESKIVCVSNGFDEEDFAAQGDRITGLLEPDVVHLSHIGSIYSQGSGNFFPALAELACEEPEVRRRLRINIIGYADQEVLKYAEGKDLRDMIHVRRFVQHDEALRVMAASHCLLIFYANTFYSRFCVPGKLYEYLRVGRPVLAVTFPGEVQELVERSGAGWAVHPNDVSGIKEALRSLLAKGTHQPSFPSPDADYVAQFSYARLTAQLGFALESVIAHA
jgi:glycosyltransferase involved in cell wall biosynthesis